MKKHTEPMSRLIHESIRISDVATLNSKNEWGGYKIPRLTVELSDKQIKEQVDKTETEDKEEGKRMS